MNVLPSCCYLQNLPEELIENILFRVPIKYLLQLKLVCKSLNSLISHPKFAKHHLRSSATLRLVSSVHGQNNLQIFSINSLFQNLSGPLRSCTITGHNLILGSCNGILCLCDIVQCHITLFNPSTTLSSPAFPTDLSPGEVYRTFHGFGYDHVNEKYKVLLVRRILTETVTKVYTFGEKRSIRVVENSQLYPLPSGRLGKCVSGTLNWMTPKLGPNDSVNEWVILSFNLVTETFGEMMLPDGNSNNICKPMINLVHNCLCVCFFDRKKACWCVWVMKEYGVEDSWTNLMMISGFVIDGLPCIRNELCSCIGCPALDPLYVSEDGMALFKTTSCRLLLYNPNDGTLNCVRVRGDIWSYHESLVSPSS
ncbi:unnamed protein product [Sphenostylis stenocarpa]|uniref:F-box domain-containing protein n=1 Tax=Sphenostylis stenocarpa TaxID=92480 RepID=A0AA86VLK5_9FABA|nr:unnamed protein product [Sphenostylis stenocarpa]